ncbi:MAG: helix-turn-helix domain-containing protein [Treponema sp.]|nr:helix-turn-helix domain-containing protein [Treponema sp.]
MAISIEFMSLRDVFITNLKKTRKQKKVSQMDLAEKCDTAASYIGEIEIGRKFPSVEMIERIAGALNIEAHRLFMDDTGKNTHESLDYLAALPIRVRLDLVERLKETVHTGIGQVLTPDYPEKTPPEAKVPEKG